MFICMSQSLESYVIKNFCRYDAIVVEGFDGVGKGTVLEKISRILGVTPYRPDYNLWQKYDHRPIDRWKVSGFFWEVFSHFGNHPRTPMLFDRGVISGAVYNNDENIAKDYKKLLGDMEVLHILVTCSEEDYYKFARIRNSESESQPYSVYLEYTERYKKYLESSCVKYTIYENKYDPSIEEDSKDKCSGCGHYSYGYCRHPAYNCRVSGDNKRCRFSSDKEVQDRVEVDV